MIGEEKGGAWFYLLQVCSAQLLVALRNGYPKGSFPLGWVLLMWLAAEAKSDVSLR